SALSSHLLIQTRWSFPAALVGLAGRCAAGTGAERYALRVIDRRLLLADLQKQVKSLEKDLREQAESVQEVRDRLRAEYDRAFKIGRTAATWAAWRDERVAQAAVAWVLGTVFVRFCEDNALLPEPFIAGPGDRLVVAEEAEAQFFRDRPQETLRGWL